MFNDPKEPKRLPETSGEFSDEVTETNQDMEREFYEGDRNECRGRSSRVASMVTLTDNT